MLLQGIAAVCLILGLLKFAKDAPDLLKNLFSNGGNLFSGLNWKPGVRSRVEDNEYFMRGSSMAIGGITGAAANAIRQRKRFMDEHTQGDGSRPQLRGAATFLASLPRGLIAGGRAGVTNYAHNLTRDAYGNVVTNSATEAQRSGQMAYDRRDHVLTNAINTALDDGYADEFVSDLFHNVTESVQRHMDDYVEHARQQGDDIRRFMTGESAAGDAVKNLSDQTSELIKQITGLVNTTAIDNAKTELNKKLAMGEIVEYAGRKYANGRAIGLTQDDFTNADPDRRFNAGVRLANGQYEYTNAHGDKFIYSKAIEDGGELVSRYNHDSNETIYNSKGLIDNIDTQKNEAIANKLNDQFRDVTATNMATLSDIMRRQISTLGTEAIKNLNTNIAKKSNGSFTDVESLLRTLSDRNSKIDANAVAALNSLKSTIEDQAKSIATRAQANNQRNQNSNNNSSNNSK